MSIDLPRASACPICTMPFLEGQGGCVRHDHEEMISWVIAERDSLIVAICGELCGDGNAGSPTRNAIACLKSMRDEEDGYITYCGSIEQERDALLYENKRLRARLDRGGK